MGCADEGPDVRVDRVQPSLIVNAAAYTAVDQAESEPGLAHQINADVPALLGRWAVGHGALIAHYSTDYVFDGSKDGAYAETDAPNPLGVYGLTKLAGDEALIASGCDHLILRVSWVYGTRGRNFLLTMQRLMAERDALNVVDDQIGAPTWCRRIAETTGSALGKLLGSEEAHRTLGGLYHLAPAGETSWFGFASAIRDAGGFDCELTPITTAEYPTPAARPANSRMDTTKLQSTLGIMSNYWDTDLACPVPKTPTGSDRLSQVDLHSMN